MKVNGHLRNYAEYLVTFPGTSSERPSFTDILCNGRIRRRYSRDSFAFQPGFPLSMCSFLMANRLKTCLVPRGRLPVMLSHLISSLSLFMARSFALWLGGRGGMGEEGRGEGGERIRERRRPNPPEPNTAEVRQERQKANGTHGRIQNAQGPRTAYRQRRATETTGSAQERPNITRGRAPNGGELCVSQLFHFFSSFHCFPPCTRICRSWVRTPSFSSGTTNGKRTQRQMFPAHIKCTSLIRLLTVLLKGLDLILTIALATCHSSALSTSRRRDARNLQ